jgi:UDP-3-O-[3-hydroxymyristoyl] glucosamine N-acyltransferase
VNLKFTVAQVAHLVGGEVLGDPQKVLTGFAPLESAKENHLSFATGDPYLSMVKESKAGAVLVPTEVEGASATLILVDNPYEAVVELLAKVYPPLYVKDEKVSPLAHISPLATLEEGVSIGPFTVIEPHAVLKSGCAIMAHCYIWEGAVVGENSVLHPHVTLYKGVKIGRRAIIHSGAVVGSPGFGYLEKDGKRIPIPQVGSVEIGDDVEVGANTCIDRGTLANTTVGRGTKLDNLIQVGHNVKIGEDCAFAGQVGISGSTSIGDKVLMGGQAGIADHTRIGDRAMIGAQAGVSGKVKDGEIVIGSPAINHTVWRRAVMAFPKLPDLLKRVRRLEKIVGEGKENE